MQGCRAVPLFAGARGYIAAHRAQIAVVGAVSPWKIGRKARTASSSTFHDPSSTFVPSSTSPPVFGPDPHPWTLLRSELYKQRLPSICTAWASPEGRRMFKEALREGTAECYLPLSCHFDAQAEPATCGLGTLAMILNAMGMQPPASSEAGPEIASGGHGSSRRRTFWTETNLPVERPWSYILKHGTDMDDVALTARKAGVGVTLVHARGDAPPDAAFRRHHHHHHQRGQRHAHEHHPSHHGPKAEPLFHKAGSSLLSSAASSLSPSSSSAAAAVSSSASPLGQDVFRRVVQAASKRASADVFVAMSFSRTALYQTGEGHFSPLGAYHRASDSVLVLESAKFKYPPHWVPVPLMWAAMQRTDWVTGRPRGYLIVGKTDAPALEY